MCIRNSGCRLLLPPTVDRIEADATVCTKFILTPVGNSGKGSEQYIAGCVLAAHQSLCSPRPRASIFRCGLDFLGSQAGVQNIQYRVVVILIYAYPITYYTNCNHL